MGWIALRSLLQCLSYSSEVPVTVSNNRTALSALRGKVQILSMPHQKYWKTMASTVLSPRTVVIYCIQNSHMRVNETQHVTLCNFDLLRALTAQS